MTDSFVHTEFWKMTVLMFVCSFFLASIFVAVHHLFKSEKKYGMEKEEEFAQGMKSCCVGCMGTFFLMMTNIGGFGALFVWLCTGKETYQSRVENAESIRSELVSTFSQETPSIKAHYDELRRLAEDNETYIAQLEKEMETLISEQARRNCSRKIAAAKKLEDGIIADIRKYEECAGELYFARFLTNLGTRFDKDDILERMEDIYAESKRQKKRYMSN